MAATKPGAGSPQICTQILSTDLLSRDLDHAQYGLIAPPRLVVHLGDSAQEGPSLSQQPVLSSFPA